jgi:hypothetical protein
MAEAELSRTTDITPGPGGVMTDEVGVVTGELTLRSTFSDGEVALTDPSDLDGVHAIAVALLNRPEG